MLSPFMIKAVGMVLLTLGTFVYISTASAEYGDIRINNFSEENHMRPVVFPHWFHRIRFRCSVCHEQLGFKMKKEANRIDMNKIAEGRFCGACHNGMTAWAPVYCERCHTGATDEHGNKKTKSKKVK